MINEIILQKNEFKNIVIYYFKKVLNVKTTKKLHIKNIENGE